MNENIENSFKNALENFEVPYDVKAWESLSSQLDKIMPVAKPIAPSSNLWKWGVGVAGLTVISLATIYVNTDNRKIIEVAKVNEVEQNLPKTTQILDQKAKESINASLVKTESKEKSTKVNLNDFSLVSSNPPFFTNIESRDVRDEPENFMIDAPLLMDVAPLQSVNTTSAKEVITETVGNITFANVKLCINEKLEVENTGSSDVLIRLNNKLFKIVAKSKSSIDPRTHESFNVEVLNTENEIITKQHIEILIQNTVSIDRETMEYVNGVPTIKYVVSNQNEVSSIVWNYANQQYNGKSASISTFVTGKTLTVTAIDQNGCKIKETQEIEVATYNLQAPTSMNLYAANYNARTFMPRDLVSRGDAFEMQIIDIRTREIVYRTSDSSNAWDGTDMKTGKVVNGGTYVWTVKLYKPKLGESSEYRGELSVFN